MDEDVFVDLSFKVKQDGVNSLKITNGAKSYWIPKAHIENLHELGRLERNKYVVIRISKLIAEQKGLI